MIVRDVMSDKLIAVPSEANLRECAHKMNQVNVGILPVSENGKMIGMISDRDICCRAIAMGRDPETTSVKDIMTNHVSFCYDDQTCNEAADLMKSRHIRRLLVMSRDQRTVGIISVDDLAHYSHDLAGKVLDLTSSFCV